MFVKLKFQSNDIYHSFVRYKDHANMGYSLCKSTLGEYFKLPDPHEYKEITLKLSTKKLPGYIKVIATSDTTEAKGDNYEPLLFYPKNLLATVLVEKYPRTGKDIPFYAMVEYKGKNCEVLIPCDTSPLYVY